MQQSSGIAVITGAASGMGLAAARLMAEQGWPLLLGDLNADALAQAAGEFAGPVDTLAGDISDKAYGERLTSALGARPIGALIHCAGVSPTMASSERILDINLAATMRLVEAARPRMAEGSAAVLFASSAAHQIGSHFDEAIGKVTTAEAVPELIPIAANPGMAYSIAKRGVYLLVRREAEEFGVRGARLVSVSPGIIDTPMGQAEMKQSPIMQAMVENSAVKRPARAEEVAAVAVFLCSPAASFVTGTDVLVDGGSLAKPLDMSIVSKGW